MKPASSKAKGRRLQDWVANKIEEYHGLRPDKAIMGERGCDVKHERLPYAIECKNTERLNLWSSWEQTRENCGGASVPLLFVKRNRWEPLCVVPAEWVLKRLEINNERETSETNQAD